MKVLAAGSFNFQEPGLLILFCKGKLGKFPKRYARQIPLVPLRYRGELIYDTEN